MGILAVDKLPGIIKLVTYYPRSDREPRMFPITLRDKSNQGPYQRVRVRTEDVSQPKADAISSNFTIDALSFWLIDESNRQRLDLAAAGTGTAGVLNIEKGRQRTLWARAETLGPGEYSATLRFGADGASEQAEESKVALTLQIRHDWIIAVIVILVGSIAGWFGKKYVEAYRTAQRLRREASALAERARFVARRDPMSVHWPFPDEASSYALIRVRVILHQIDRLTNSIFSVIAAEQEIVDRLADATGRLTVLEEFQAARLRLQQVGAGQFSAEHEIGGKLEKALDILDRPAFGNQQRDEVTKMLKDLEARLAPNVMETLSRAAVLKGIRKNIETESLPTELHGPIEAWSRRSTSLRRTTRLSTNSRPPR